ncbi:hypothetical protein G5V57_03290 [Nordella sp. HKS 07]|uniref:hypothetical protein n=1 Tax=Nordella sp. HKS 07 TaxID=2712222 RepID=UPI0013E0F0F8|nr:hypothetical protein [Nordella sp. HKS 07]QIG46854.1 hypothetical protein G5V57_03290 [Nordella sp. HKS 07]
MAKKQNPTQLRALKTVAVIIVLAAILAYFGPWLSENIGQFNASLVIAVLIVAYFQSETSDLAVRIAFLERRMLGVTTKENR